MPITYMKLREILAERNIKWTEIRKNCGISTDVIARINKNEYVSLQTLDKIAEYLKVDIGDIVQRK